MPFSTDHPNLETFLTEFYNDNREMVDGFVKDMRTAGCLEEDFDMMVHDLADHEGYDSQEASNVNNESIALQASGAIIGYGIDEARRLVLEEIAGRHTAPGV